MTELSKRIYTSLFLIITFSFSIINNFILFLVLVFCFFQIFFEFYFLLKKSLSKKNKLILFLSLLLIIILLTYLICFIWITLNFGSNIDKIFLYFLISISIASDIGGFTFGKIFKGKKLTKISPKKTYSGMFGAFFTSYLITYLFFSDIFDYKVLFLLTFIISMISQLGDIFISYLKRTSNFKDTGNLLPGHGGILDRFDGIIFAITIGSLIKIMV